MKAHNGEWKHNSSHS